MSIYTEFITYYKIISPVNGYSVGRITKSNIKNFGFDSVKDLLRKYPNFPLVSESYIDTQREASIKREQKKLELYSQSPTICRQCQIIIPYEKRNCNFCSKSCSAIFTNKQKGPRSESTKKNISNSIRSFNKSNPDHAKNKNWKFKPTINSVCIVCNSEHTRNRKTCSDECYTLHARNNALKQEKHGSGKKGRYKGIYSDSTWELAFIIYHLDHGNDIKRCKEIRNYTKNGITKKYIPDFVIDNNIYEIKGYMSETAKLKIECNPDIIVIDKNGIKPYINYVKKTYNTNKIEDLYEEKDFNIITKNM